MVNDTSIIFGIISVFVFLGVLLPFYSEYDITSNPNVNGTITDIGGGTDEGSSSFWNSGLTTLQSIAKMFFWYGGIMPFWLDMVFMVFRIMLIWFIVRWIRGVG